MQQIYKKRMPLLRRQIVGRLQADIAAGKYPVGAALPPVKELAGLLKASYVTVIKALKELEHDGVIECRHGVGNFVLRRTGQGVAEEKILCILHSGIVEKHKPNYPPGVQDQILEKCVEKFQQAGWTVRFFPTAIGNERQLLEMASRENIFFLLMALRPFGCMEAIWRECAGRRMVSVGEVFDNMPSVTCDENQVMRLLLEHLTDCGRERIAFVCANLDSPIERERAGVWRSFCYYQDGGFDCCSNLFLDMKMPEYAVAEQYVNKLYDDLKASGKLEHIQAIITPDGEIAALLMGRLMDDGYRIPEDIAIASASMDRIGTLFRPRITSVDVDVEAHAQMVLEIVESMTRGVKEPSLHYVCRPRLQIRDSSRTGGR